MSDFRSPISGVRWFCAQIGAREHYAIPRALRQAGQEVTLYTDFWAGPVVRALGKSKVANGKWKLGAMKSLAARWHPELQEKAETLKPEIGKAEGGKQKTDIVSWNLRALWWEAGLRRRIENSKSKIQNGQASGRQPSVKLAISDLRSPISHAPGPYHGFIEVGRGFATRVREDLKRRKDLAPGSIFYAYDTGALEAFEWCREHGIKCVLNQMDPNRVEVALVREEEKQWPGWALESVQVPEPYFARREREWALADRVVVNSEFSRQALLQQGVPEEKLLVIPLCFEVADENRKSEIGNRKSDQPLRVLFLGQVILRKGVQYLIAAAKLLEKENVHFDVVGPAGISKEAMATAPGNLTFHGRTSRDQVAAWYQKSHVFVLPTLSDGFAITQLEAMAHGLPVVTTPNCGEVVGDGVDGFVVPARDAGALAGALQRYLDEPELLGRQSAAALIKARQFSLERLADNLGRLEAGLRRN